LHLLCITTDQGQNQDCALLAASQWQTSSTSASNLSFTFLTQATGAGWMAQRKIACLKQEKQE
jgi:hypothetical protein